MRARTSLAIFVVAASLLTGTAGSALGSDGTGPGQPPGHSIRCERFGAKLDRLEARLETVANRIARLGERLAGGQLAEKQAAKAAKRLTKLEKAEEKLTLRIAKLSARIAEKCGDDGEASPADTADA